MQIFWVMKAIPLTSNGQLLKIKTIDRNRVISPIEIEKIVTFDHPVRAIWEFVEQLNLDLYYKEIKSRKGEVGRPAFSPELLISLWILAYSEGTNSAREISRKCEYDPPYQWLTGGEVINYHTISDFRIDNKEALNGLFIQILGILSVSGLITPLAFIFSSLEL